MRELPIQNEDFAVLKRVMQNVDLFAKLSMGQLEDLCRTMDLLYYDPNEVIIKQGASGDSFFILQSGKVRVTKKKGMFSKPSELATLGPGDFFGEMALFAKAKRNATITAVSATRAFILKYPQFKAFLLKNEGFKKQVLDIAKERNLTNRLKRI